MNLLLKISEPRIMKRAQNKFQQQKKASIQLMKPSPALTASFAIAETSLELPAIFSPHLIASETS